MAGGASHLRGGLNWIRGSAPAFWRRSLQARVIASVLVLSAVVVGVVGFSLLRQITSGLVNNRVQASITETKTEISTATRDLRQSGSAGFDPSTQLTQLVDSMASRGRDRGFDVVVIGPISDSSNEIGGAGIRTSRGISSVSVPAKLRSAIAGGADLAWAYTTITSTDGAAPREGVAVGSHLILPSDGGTYGVYLLYPLTEERNTLALVRNSLLTAGAILLLALGGLTFLVIRQVVTPIRAARRVAERIASGRLNERMEVSGDDDIARLAVSFNQMTDALQQQIRRLEDLSRVQRRFVSDVSHELRTPLTTVRMAGDVLHDERERFDPVTARAAELLHNELDRFETLLADLLEISRFDAGAANLLLVDVDLVDVAERVIAQTEPLARQRGVVVLLRADGPARVEADVRRVERIVRNLVSNAIDHAESRDVIVTVAANDEAAALSVRDYGVGLRPGEAAQVFNRFWRADPARARTSGGTGLGLAIALEDAHLHGGQLQVWGLPGQGALFRMTVPLRVDGEWHQSPLPLIPEDHPAVAEEPS